MLDLVFSDIMDESCHYGLVDIVSINIIHKVVVLVKDRLGDIAAEFAVGKRGVIVTLEEGADERSCLRVSILVSPSVYVIELKTENLTHTRKIE